MNGETQRVGELRASQLLHTFGVGAVVDLPNISVVVRGLDDWKKENTGVLRENRLLAAVRGKLGGQVKELRTPPYTPPTKSVYDDWTRVGVPVAAFPRWLRCTRCRRLASADSGLFELLSDPYRPDRVRFVHGCHGQGGKRPSAVPARFVLACEAGHLDDFPWMYFVHYGSVPEAGEGGHTLSFSERGSSGEARNLFVLCGCGQRRAMSEAIGQEYAERNLPACRGRHPHLGTFEGCGGLSRAMSLSATNAWFPLRISAFTLPEADTALDDEIARNWDLLGALAVLPKESALNLVEAMAFWPELERFGRDAVWDTIQARSNGEAEQQAEHDDTDLATPEWRTFTGPDVPDLPEFTTKTVPTPPSAASYLERVLLVPRLRQVSALYGFTRIDAPEFDVVATEDARVAPLSAEAPLWAPCAEQRGEGIFLKFREERIAEWERSAAVIAREALLRDGHDRWREKRGMKPGEWPGARYLLLHSLAHCLIREFSLEAGYSAAGIAERVYARTGEEPMAGILLYTAAPDSEGTLGGLVSLAEEPARLEGLLVQALDAARLCSSDPLCSEHDPTDSARLHGAACHACLFAAETSCEHNNHYLDRALVVETMAGTGKETGFFG
ncbi:DUF1998 domain-containing protein [Nocardiopsis potens]|uniref:DUF1998 domain-containing protein n=1 Tax=Nocardiopsis potens TaxID=1246458 RepID=UPI00034D389E|nr:DUF1998 domain-containing protein [Nocardiopsis potens]